MSQETLQIADVNAARTHGAYMTLENLSVIAIKGKDAASFLHGRTSSDVKALAIGQGQLSSLLDRKGYLIAFVTIHRVGEDSFWVVSDKTQSKTILEQFQTYHFREKIEYREIADSITPILILGPLAETLLNKSQRHPISKEEYSYSECTLLDIKCSVIRRSLSGDSGFILMLAAANTEQASKIASELESAGVHKIDAKILNVLRIEAGIPFFGTDIDAEHLLPETGFEQYAASYNKGCFQGQEVLARIKTYGAPKRALVGLIFDEAPAADFELNSNFSINGDETGTIKSNCFSPTLEKHIAMAFISRDYRVPEKKLSISVANKEYTATVKFLPFYSAVESKERAKRLYDAALKEFAEGSEEQAIIMLREVIELDPLLADAYESLGVILSRHEQYDEAIALMHRLKDLIPDSVMAHTNLSVYYMHLGDKERAEEEKAISMSIRMSQLAKEHAKKKQEEAEKKASIEEQERRLDMFHQVLKIDPADFLANNGVGTVYVELGKFTEAIPFLLKAIEVKPTHTVAYVALGKAYEALNEIAQARKVYEAGIDLAAKRGDITPMKEMQAHLDLLSSKS